MRNPSPWVALLLASLVSGCPLPQTAGDQPIKTPSPSPTPSTAPEEVVQDLDITVRSLVLDETETIRMDVEAAEALLIVPVVAQQNYFLRLEDLSTEEAASYRTACLRGASVRQAPPIAPRRFSVASTEATGSLEATMSFKVGPKAITGERVYSGTHCLVYADTRDLAGSEQALNELGQAFDARIHPAVTETLGDAPAGRASDGFNRGDDRTVIVLSREAAQFDGPSAWMPTDWLPITTENPDSNYAKVLYLAPGHALSASLPSLAHRLGEQTFFGRRLEAYSRLKQRNLPAGKDPAYLAEAFPSEVWLTVAMGRLAGLVSGFTPESGDRVALTAAAEFLDLPNRYQLDLLSRPGYYARNNGQLMLLAAYLHGQAPAVGLDAVAHAMQKDFVTLFRDFSVALALDGLNAIPPRYQIPFVDLHKTYVGDGMRFTHLRFPSGKGRLTITGQPGQTRAALILIKPSEQPTFRGE